MWVVFFFPFALILFSGRAHAVTQAVVVNQKILIENTGKRETGNIGRSWLTGTLKSEATAGHRSCVSYEFLCLIFLICV